MSGDGKDGGHETADEVHPPCPPAKPDMEESDRDDDHGTELHGHGSSTNTINSKKISASNPSDPRVPPLPPPSTRSPSSLIKQVPQACSFELRKERGGTVDQSMVESSHNQDRPPLLDADGHPQIVTRWRLTGGAVAQGPADSHEDSSHWGGSLRNEWFKMKTFDASEEAAVVQGAAAATGNTGSREGISCWPFLWRFKKDSEN